jgi:hypothetical protein
MMPVPSASQPSLGPASLGVRPAVGCRRARIAGDGAKRRPSGRRCLQGGLAANVLPPSSQCCDPTEGALAWAPSAFSALCTSKITFRSAGPTIPGNGRSAFGRAGTIPTAR